MLLPLPPRAQHRLRKAQIRHRELDLEGRRVDARIASLESLATQATLLAGFSYAVISPSDEVSGVLAPSGQVQPPSADRREQGNETP